MESDALALRGRDLGVIVATIAILASILVAQATARASGEPPPAAESQVVAGAP